MIHHGKHLPEALGWEEENLGGGELRWRRRTKVRGDLGGEGELQGGEGNLGRGRRLRWRKTT